MSDIFIIAGGDRRSVYLARELSEKNKVYAVGFEPSCFSGCGVICCNDTAKLKDKADAIVLPIPCSEDGICVYTPLYSGKLMLSSLVSCISDNGVVFGGNISDSVRYFFEGFGYSVTDYFKREELVVLNAEITAEGAIQTALCELDEVLLGMKVLIFGMGRISKLLIKQLSAFGADITVAARRYSSLAWAEAMGCRAVLLSELDSTDIISKAGLIINTVPALVIDGKRLAFVQKKCLILDLASKPGGVDTDTAGQLGLKTVWALGLPGKTAPVSSGKIIGRTICNILNEIND